MPAFTFENKPINWTSFTKDLSILLPGYPPKNRYLLKQFIKKSEVPTKQKGQDETQTEGNPRSSKKKKYTEEELAEKKRREKPYSYEYYVEGRHIVRDAKALRIQQIAGAMIKKSRINYYQQMRNREAVENILEQNEFIHHMNFMPDTSFPIDPDSKDPFDIFNTECLEGETAKKRGLKSAASSELEKIQERPSERLFQNYHNLRNELRLSKNSKEKNTSRLAVEKSDKDTVSTFFAESNISKAVRRKSDSSLWSGGISKMELKTQNICVDLLPILHKRKEKLSQKLPRIEFSASEQTSGLPDSSPTHYKSNNARSTQKRRNSFIIKPETAWMSNIHKKNLSIHQALSEAVSIQADRKSYPKNETESENQKLTTEISISTFGSSTFTNKSVRGATYINKDIDKCSPLTRSNSNPQEVKMFRDVIEESIKEELASYFFLYLY